MRPAAPPRTPERPPNLSLVSTASLGGPRLAGASRLQLRGRRSSAARRAEVPRQRATSGGPAYSSGSSGYSSCHCRINISAGEYLLSVDFDSVAARMRPHQASSFRSLRQAAARPPSQSSSPLKSASSSAPARSIAPREPPALRRRGGELEARGVLGSGAMRRRYHVSSRPPPAPLAPRSSRFMPRRGGLVGISDPSDQIFD